MELIDNLKKLGLKENRVFLFLIVWLLIAFACMEIFKLFDMPIIGVIIYFPLLGFTLFLWFISLFRKKIRDISMKKIILLLVVDFIFMLAFLFIIVILLIISVFSYIFFTSFFFLYGCYRAGKKTDERLYYKKGSWFWRKLEYFGGLTISLTLLFVFLMLTWTATTITGVTVLLLIAYIAVIIVIMFFAVLSLIISLFQKRLNAWLGVYFLFITGYTFYLVLKVFLSLYGTSGGESPLYWIIVLIILDLLILIYSISSILGTKGEILVEKFKIVKMDTALLWLIFCKASWEFAANFPYGTFGFAQAMGIQNVTEIGYIVNLIANILILAVFFFLIIIFGFYGLKAYGEDKERMKAGKIELTQARKSGERDDDDIKKGGEILRPGDDDDDEDIDNKDDM